MLIRLLSGILAVTFLPLGLAFVVVGLVVDEPRSGTPEAFLYVGAALAAVGLVLAVVFLVARGREAERRRRRQAGTRTQAEVVTSRVNRGMRVNGSPALELTVRFAAAGTVSGTFFIGPTDGPTEGAWIDVLYDPGDPSNFEPVGPRRRAEEW